jgi:small subunit ribosomal protein S21
VLVTAAYRLGVTGDSLSDARDSRDSARALQARGPKEVILIVQVVVRDNNVDQALKALKKKMQREGVFREMKLRRSYEKPSEKKARERAEAIRRARKLARKRKEREGF